jgi:hypothetical protein
MNPRHRNVVMSVATLRGAPRERSTLEIRDKRRTILLERKLATRRDLLAAELVLIPEENKRSRNFPRVIILKSSRRPNHPPSTGEIKKGEEAEAWLLGLKKYFRVHDFSENLKA